MNIEKLLENSGFSPEEKKRASEIFRQLEGLKISEAEMILSFCAEVLDQCVITVSPVFTAEDPNGMCAGGDSVECPVNRKSHCL
ncbi:hypothetical protein [Oscillibacter sp.]|uniref:hypothetical protein n=1 Tax=Oscillibacter sp. TaxID=1945593 RepID=UPI00289ECF88|nr:hypothetical protein [Oscillibacter sp.]